MNYLRLSILPHVPHLRMWPWCPTVLNLAVPLKVELDELFHLFVPLFSHLQTEDNNRVPLTEKIRIVSIKFEGIISIQPITALP